MDDTVEVRIPVDPAAAALLTDAHKREAVGRVISSMLRRSSQGGHGDHAHSPADLYAGYLAMAADEQREADATEWTEGLVGDVAREPSPHDR